MRLTDSIVKTLSPPVAGEAKKVTNKVYYDSLVKGFGVRVTAAGARAFVLNYRTRKGRERRYTIGAFPRWKTAVARKEAERLKDEIRVNGVDPLAVLQAERGEPTMADLCEQYIKEHLPTKRKRSALDDRGMIAGRVLPALGALKVTEVTPSDIRALHRKITASGHPTRANRVLALLSSMFTLATTDELKWRSDNPTKGVKRNHEEPRDRYLSGSEIAALTEALAKHGDQQSANIIRLLLLTGARSGEVLAMRWEDLDLETGHWTKPAANTKQKKLHRVPLSSAARQLLADLAKSDSEYVFPGRSGGHRMNVREAWADLCKAAGIKDTRLHDLRHTYASLAASGGSSLPILGALLGHTQVQTTARYAHFLDDPLRAVTDRVGNIISPSTGKNADIIKIRGDRA
jgi:integrase